MYAMHIITSRREVVADSRVGASGTSPRRAAGQGALPGSRGRPRAPRIGGRALASARSAAVMPGPAASPRPTNCCCAVGPSGRSRLAIPGAGGVGAVVAEGLVDGVDEGLAAGVDAEA